MLAPRPDLPASSPVAASAPESAASSRGSLAAWLPLDMGTRHVRFHVSETHLLWQGRGGATTILSWGDIDFVRLEARLSWAHAAAWYAPLLVLYLGGGLATVAIMCAAVSAAAVANLFLRRRYVLTIAPRIGAPVRLFLGAGCAPGALALARSSWVAALIEGYTWLRQDAERHGVAVRS
jgi:hypothetical protein